MVNAWRPISTIRRDPFAVADSTSVREEDLAEFTRWKDGIGSKNFFIRNTDDAQPGGGEQKWYYMNEQRSDEVLIFKLWDSGYDADSGERRVQATRTPHASFIDTERGEEKPRESIEIRAALWWT